MRRLAAILLVLGLAACDGEDPVTSATREIATANHAAAAVAQAEAEAKAKADAPAAAEAACDVEVSFGSFGSGVDTTLRDQILALTRGNHDVVASTEKPWGREGETTLCLKARDEQAANRLYGTLAAQLPSSSTRAPTTVRHSDGRSRSVAYPTGQ
jgi:hypothetical protein